MESNSNENRKIFRLKKTYMKKFAILLKINKNNRVNERSKNLLNNIKN